MFYSFISTGALEDRVASITEEKRNLQLHLETFLNESFTMKEQVKDL